MNIYKKTLLLFAISLVAINSIEAQQKRHKAKKTMSGQNVTDQLESDSKNAGNQNGPKKPGEITVTSEFQPSLNNIAKINFTAATPLIDTARIVLNYKIPSQSLFFTYRPVSIKPVALLIDSLYHWQNDNYVKVGYGNYRTPYLEAGVALGNGQSSMVSFKGSYTSSKGNLPFQKFGRGDFNYTGIFNTDKFSFNTAATYKDRLYYRYGIGAADSLFRSDSLRSHFQNFGVELGMKNKTDDPLAFSYHPQIGFHYYHDNFSDKEYRFKADVPFHKLFMQDDSTALGADLSLMADLTALRPGDSTYKDTSSNVLSFTPSFFYRSKGLTLHLGFTPAWDGGQFHLFPSVIFANKLLDGNLVLEAGWTGKIDKNTYASLSDYNPYIKLPQISANSREMEEYLGLKFNSGSHFSYQVRAFFKTIHNLPLFVTDTASLQQQNYHVLFASQARLLGLHAELSYTMQEKLTILGGATFTDYTDLKDYDKAWGYKPLELTGTLRYRVLHNWLLKTDLFFWNGIWHRNRDLSSSRGSSVLDVNIGSEVTILPHLNVWLQMNNILNNHYERWNRYQTLGLNALGGIVYSF